MQSLRLFLLQSLPCKDDVEWGNTATASTPQTPAVRSRCISPDLGGVSGKEVAGASASTLCVDPACLGLKMEATVKPLLWQVDTING